MRFDKEVRSWSFLLCKNYPFSRTKACDEIHHDKIMMVQVPDGINEFRLTISPLWPLHNAYAALFSQLPL
jgi:hypothetical protein